MEFTRKQYIDLVLDKHKLKEVFNYLCKTTGIFLYNEENPTMQIYASPLKKSIEFLEEGKIDPKDIVYPSDEWYSNNSEKKSNKNWYDYPSSWILISSNFNISYFNSAFTKPSKEGDNLIDFFKEFHSYLNWSLITIKYTFCEEYIDQLGEYLDWEEIFKFYRNSSSLLISEKLIDKYSHKINWETFMKYRYNDDTISNEFRNKYEKEINSAKTKLGYRFLRI